MLRSSSQCSVPLCASANNTNTSCAGSQQNCYAYTVALSNQTFCAPAASCSLFEACTEELVCSSNVSICLSNTCCPQPICVPISLAVINCGSIVPTLLPPQCYNHVINSDATRNAAYNQTFYGCDQTEFATSKWVRFSGAAGTKLATSISTASRCGTTYPGYLNDSHPTVVGETKRSTVCYYYSGMCYYQNTVSVTNCRNYFVYYLSSPPTCSLRYCTV